MARVVKTLRKLTPASPAGQSAKSHQKDLAKISGTVAANKVSVARKKKGLMEREDKPTPAFVAGKKAVKKTAATFKKSR